MTENIVKKQLHYAHLGQLKYDDGLELQHTLLEERKNNRIPNTVITVEHTSAYTLGRRGKLSDILINEDERYNLGVGVHTSDRGGEVTYHGPGQLVVYPIIRLTEFGLGANSYVRLLEKLIIKLVGEFDIKAYCIEGKPGVYVHRNTDGVVAKIAAIGVRVSSGVTMHGFALNVTTDLKYFDYIVPCGSPGMPGASIQSESNTQPSLQQVSRRAIEMFTQAVNVEFTEQQPSQILKNYHRKSQKGVMSDVA